MTRSVQTPAAKLGLHQYVFWAAWALIVAIPLGALGYYLSGAVTPDAVRNAFAQTQIAGHITGRQVALVSLLGLLPWVVGIWGLFLLQDLMRVYRAGAALSYKAAATMSHIGTTLLVLAVTQVLTQTAQILVLTAANPPGTRVLSITFGAEEVGFVLAAGLMVLMGQTTAKAAAQAEEMRGFV